MYIFADLDNTLIRRAPLDGYTGPLEAAAYESGVPTTVMTAADLELLAHLRSTGVIIPVTGRSIQGYQKINLLWKYFSSYLVLNHGATILGTGGADQMGTLCPSWQTRTESVAEVNREAILKIFARLKQSLVTGQVRLHEEFGLALYVSARLAPNTPESAFAALRFAVEQQVNLEVFEVLHTGRISSVIPRALSKRAAVLELTARLGRPQTLGVGDSLTDLPFMTVCDQQLAPIGSEAARAGVATL
jgi:hydroxymethylpyrimidine pyrophosphatase-like HAD family hydrolase